MLRLESQRGLAAAVGEDAHLFLSQRGLRVLACAILRKGRWRRERVGGLSKSGGILKA